MREVELNNNTTKKGIISTFVLFGFIFAHVQCTYSRWS
jgi:hypothetical protein